MHSLRTIVVGTDFSSAADAAIDTAISIAKVTTARVTIVHVCSPGSSDDDIARARDQLDSELTRRLDTGVELTTLLRVGRPFEKINNAAADVGARLIVLGRSGADGATELGSVAERILRNASRPVLVICAKESVS